MHVSLSSVRLFLDPLDCSPTGSSVRGISQARILVWVAIPFSRGSSRPKDGTQVSCLLHWQVNSLPLETPGKRAASPSEVLNIQETLRDASPFLDLSLASARAGEDQRVHNGTEFTLQNPTLTLREYFPVTEKVSLWFSVHGWLFLAVRGEKT